MKTVWSSCSYKMSHNNFQGKVISGVYNVTSRCVTHREDAVNAIYAHRKLIFLLMKPCKHNLWVQRLQTLAESDHMFEIPRFKFRKIDRNKVWLQPTLTGLRNVNAEVFTSNGFELGVKWVSTDFESYTGPKESQKSRNST